MDNKIFSVDRLEGELAVCISDDDVEITVPASILGGLEARDVFSARIEGDTLTDIVHLPEEKERRIESSRSRLRALAKRTKNRN